MSLGQGAQRDGARRGSAEAQAFRKGTARTTGDNRKFTVYSHRYGLIVPPSSEGWGLIVLTIAKAGRPGATCTCTSTARASIPSKATVETR
ncbi:hypothetical protein IVB03_21960 [Bradyrhizobium sp. 168]|nr:hypothetical protein [Bradyrhizobium sp. 168]UPK15544.1 hypothetical protein IVA93_36745 [Bradyrhizobium sp. 155]UPK23084.1 hypothetical protein IVA73_36985 [Bradyrhizobium sp. 131]